MKKIEPIPPSLPLLTKGEFYLEDEEIFWSSDQRR